MHAQARHTHTNAAATLQASADMVSLYALLPPTGRLVVNGGADTRDVPADAIGKGDLVRVLPGDRVPVDGVVATGRASVDESALTGEPMPVSKAKGDAVAAGTVNVDGARPALHRWIPRPERMAAAPAPVARPLRCASEAASCIPPARNGAHACALACAPALEDPASPAPCARDAAPRVRDACRRHHGGVRGGGRRHGHR